MSNMSCFRHIAVILAVSFFLGVAPGLASEKEPLRSGEVYEVVKSGVWIWIGVRDDAGEAFWVMATNCTVGVGGNLELLEGKFHEGIRSKLLRRTFENCYEGTLIRVNGQEFSAYGVHGLPDGCIDLSGGTI